MKIDRWAVAFALVLSLGAVLAKVHEPNVRVERITSGSTPALLFTPTDVYSKGTALLAHGVTASKETMFFFGESLAAAGFRAISIDFPGHGESPLPFRQPLDLALREGSEVVGTKVDVLVGYSMGGGVASRAIEEHRIERPRRFVALGAAPPNAQLYLVGKHEELVTTPPERTVTSPWSDHALEAFDPVLARALVEDACSLVNAPVPPPPTRWRVRLAGVLLVLAGTCGLAERLLRRTSGRRAWLVGLASGGAFATSAFIALDGAFAGGRPTPHRLVAWLVVTTFTLAGSLVASWVTGRLARGRAPRIEAYRATTVHGGVAAFAILLGAAAALSGFSFPALIATIFALVVGGAGAVAQIVERRTGSSVATSVAFAVILGYVLGQWAPHH